MSPGALRLVGLRFGLWFGLWLVEKCRDLMERPTFTSVTPSGLADELQKLAALRDAGVLSEAQFANAKAKLLSRASGGSVVRDLDQALFIPLD